MGGLFFFLSILEDSGYMARVAFVMDKLLRKMCRGDAFGIPRLGDKASVEAITPEGLFRHYKQILRTSPVQLFYVGSAQPEYVAALLLPLFAGRNNENISLPEQTPFRDPGGAEKKEEMQKRNK